MGDAGEGTTGHIVETELLSESRISAFDIKAFITRNLRLQAAPTLPHIVLYTGHAGSRLSRLGGMDLDAPAPYWAYDWAGGTVLARHITEYPEIVRGRRVLDLGTGSGIVAIAAAKSGAAEVIAADTDANAIAATELNASANAVSITALHADLLLKEPPTVDVILVGDLFYEESLATRVLDFLTACNDAGIEVLVGDPFRAPLPEKKLRLVAEYPVPDFGEAAGAPSRRAGIFTLNRSA